MNKDRRKLRGLIGGSAVIVCLSAMPAVVNAQATTSNVLGGFNPVGQVGVNTPIASFGRVGGKTTSSFGGSQYGSRQGPSESAAGKYLGGASYGASTSLNYSVVPTAAAGARSTPSLTSLNQNAAMATQFFGKNATTSVLGRVNVRTSGSAMDYLVPSFDTRAVAARASRFYQGRTPAAALLDRNQTLLTPKSALGQMAYGPRNSQALNQSLEDADQNGAPAPADGLPGATIDAGASAIPAGLTREQRQAFRTNQELRSCIERGDDYMRAATGDPDKRARNFERAKASYERARTIAPDLATPYCRLFLVTLLMSDYAQSGMYLRLGTRRAKTASDLQLEPAECTPSVDELRSLARTIGQANLRAETSEAEFLTVAYLSWLLDDTAIMRGELDRSARVSTGSPESAKLRGLLLGAATAQPQS